MQNYKKFIKNETYLTYFIIFARKIKELTKMKEKKQRIDWIDMAKGYGIIFVLIGHCDMPIVTDYIYAFHIPLFFFLSGYVFKRKSDLYPFLLNKIKRMVIPYFCLCIPMIFFDLYFGNRNVIDFDSFMSEAYSFVLQERHTTLWYLSTLILITFIMYPLVRYHIKFIVSFVSFSCLCGLFLWRNDILALPWNLDAALVVLPFFGAGYIAKTHLDSFAIIQSHKYKAIIAIILTFLFTVIITYGNLRLSGNKIDIFCSFFGIEWLSIIAAFTGIITCILISMLHTIDLISYIGRNSLLYFAWHQSIVMPSLSYIYWKTGINNWHIYQDTTLFKWITIVLTILIISIMNEIISRSKLKVILGK